MSSKLYEFDIVGMKRIEDKKEVVEKILKWSIENIENYRETLDWRWDAGQMRIELKITKNKVFLSLINF